MGLELRMFGVAPFQLGPLHAGIQFQHAATMYERKFHTPLYEDWADNWMTSIVKNGGSTNTSTDPERRGSVNKFYDQCVELGIDAVYFTEITMGDQITCVALIADERTWDLDTWPNIDLTLWGAKDPFDYLNPDFSLPRISAMDPQEAYNQWVELVGGRKNVFLRQVLRPMPLWKP